MLIKITKNIAPFLLCIACMLCSPNVHGQTLNKDSLAAKLRIQQELSKKDSILQDARNRQIADSLAREVNKIKIQQYRDSLQLAREEQRRQDSVKREAFRLKIIEDRRIRDSTLASQRAEMSRLADERKRIADSIRLDRKKVSDSLANVRKEAQRQRDLIRKYKTSKSYKDSVALARKTLKDSIKNERDKLLAQIKEAQLQKMDSIKKARKAENDFLTAKRQKELDSIKLAQTAYRDSIKAYQKSLKESLLSIRKAKQDSMDKSREKEKEIAKKSQKSDSELAREKAKQIHERKKGSWTNEKLLKKPWRMNRRIYQNTVTRYNSYYNARLRYDEAIAKLKKNHKDIYSQRISLLPYSLEGSIGVIGSDMDTVIKKCAFDTQIHDPRSKWFDNVYLLMGKAFFHKNDYEGAITAFQFVVNEYKDEKVKKGKSAPNSLNEIKMDSKDKIQLATHEKRTGLNTLAHHSVRNEALVWLTRTYTNNQQYPEAQSLIQILKDDKEFPERLKSELYLAEAELEIKQGNTLSAIEPLQLALKEKDMDKKMRQRASYLLAQLYGYDDNMALSNKYYSDILKQNPPLEMEYFAQINLATNALKGVGDKQNAINQLENIGKNEKFKLWRGQTFLTLGKIIAETDQKKGIDYLEQCLKQDKNQAVVTATAYDALGGIYYKNAQYAPAKMAYDSAFQYGQIANPSLSNMDEIKLRKEVLTDVVFYTNQIHIQDSLQALSKLTEKEQLAVIDEELKRRRKEEKNKLKEQANSLTAVALTPGNFGKNAWYFYNNAVVQQGVTDFESKWGKRENTDNWRRSNSNANAATSQNNSVVDNTPSVVGTKLNSTEAQKLFDALFKTSADFKNSDDTIIEAMYQLGLIYSSRLNDYPLSIQVMENLVQRFPDNRYEPNAYYSLFLNNTKVNKVAEATKYKNLLASKFSNTDFAALSQDPEFLTKQSGNTGIITAYYDSTYSVFLAQDYMNSLKRAVAGKLQFPNNNLMAKFELIQAKSLAGLKSYDSARAVTESIIQKYPGTKEQIHAQEFLVYLTKGAAIKPGLQDAIGETEAPTLANGMSDQAVYTFTPNAPHYLLIHLKQINGNAMGLKAGFTDFNTIRYSDKKYGTNMNLLDRNSAVLSIVEFKDQTAAKKYMTDVKKEKILFRNLEPSVYDIYIISAENFKELLKTRKIEEYGKFYKSKY